MFIMLLLRIRAAGYGMYGILLGLRTLITMGVGLLVWYVVVLAMGAPEQLLKVLLPVWLGGIAGGAVCSIFSPRDGIIMAFTSGVLVAGGFLWVRHVIYGMGLGENTMVTLWPLWFPPAYYVGAFVYILVLKQISAGKS
jgi:hypothetical protein